MNLNNQKLSQKQLTEKKYYNSLVHNKWDDKSLLVEKRIPPFGYYSSDLFDCAKKFIGDLKDKKILEIGCGNGELSVWFAMNGAEVYGLDISDESVEIAKKRAAENNILNNVYFFVSPAEKTHFEDNFFDVVYINVSLHHLEVDKALAEIKRVLKANGLFVAVEPCSFSSFLQRIRVSKLISTIYPIRQETPTERILTLADLKLIEKNFTEFEYKPYRILSPFIFKFKPLFHFLANKFYKKENDPELRMQKMNRKIQMLDEALLKNLPFMAMFARYVVFKGRRG